MGSSPIVPTIRESPWLLNLIFFKSGVSFHLRVLLRLAVVRLSFASVAQLEEQLICTQQVAGSIPARSSNASVAQLVERWSPKPVVGGSSPSRRAQTVLLKI